MGTGNVRIMVTTHSSTVPVAIVVFDFMMGK